MVKKGDTLIEVTLAVGIFSMIAIAIVAVMSNGVANAQTALESTLAREEIDMQAEALRFIQASYIVNANSDDKRYTTLWDEITKNAIVLAEDDDTEARNAIVQYAPKSCEELYDASALNNIYDQHGFVLNPRKLGEFTEDTIGDVYFTARDNSDKFAAATIYPRLVFGEKEDEINDTTLISQYDSLYRAEGVYIVPVRDANTTVVVSEEGNVKTSAFFDFYIRTCWYGNRSSDASIISTVIRLYDPDAVPIIEPEPESEPEPGPTPTPTPESESCTGTIANSSNMNEVCSCPNSLAIGQTYTLTDSRDGSRYKVAKLADGKCWMLDNLQLDLTNSAVVNGLNTNNTHASTDSITSLKSGNRSKGAQYATAGLSLANWTDSATASSSIPMVNTSYKDTATTNYGVGDNKMGVFYNLCAASAGSYCYDLDSTPDGTLNIGEDICPYGWKLPNFADYYQLYTKSSNFAVDFSISLSGYRYQLGWAVDGGRVGHIMLSEVNSVNIRAPSFSGDDSGSLELGNFGYGSMYTGGFHDDGFSIRCLVGS